MATVSNRVTAIVYGTVQGAPPYIGANPFARQDSWSQPLEMSFPTLGTTFHPTTQGIRFGNYYVYSIIEVFPQGLNQPSTKFGTSSSVAALATGSQI